MGGQQTEQLPATPTHLHLSSAATDAELQNISLTQLLGAIANTIT